MQIKLFNRLGCHLNTWDSVSQMVNDIRRGYTVFADGDRLEFADEDYDQEPPRNVNYDCDPIADQRMDAADFDR